MLIRDDFIGYIDRGNTVDVYYTDDKLIAFDGKVKQSIPDFKIAGYLMGLSFSKYNTNDRILKVDIDNETYDIHTSHSIIERNSILEH